MMDMTKVKFKDSDIRNPVKMWIQQIDEHL